MDYAVQRKNMVESQVRPSDVTDRRIIRAMQVLPRELFVPESRRDVAYMDGAVPQAEGNGAARRMLLPARTLAKLVQAADVDASASVLVIGSGTGYGAAVLAQLAASVIALEADTTLATTARRLLAEVGAGAVKVVEGPLAQGWADDGPYDAIVLDGAAEEIAPELLDQLKDGGRLVGIQGGGNTGRATVWRRDGKTFGSATMFDAAAAILPGFEKPRAFSF